MSPFTHAALNASLTDASMCVIGTSVGATPTSISFPDLATRARSLMR